MADEQEVEASTVEATIVAPGRKHEVRVGVNGEVKKFPVNKPVQLTDYQVEALRNAGYQLAVDGETAASAEGSALAAGTDENRTDPHEASDEADQNDGEATAGGVGARDDSGAPVLLGGDEPNPRLHDVTGNGVTAGVEPLDPAKARDPLDHDNDGNKGGSEPKKPVALTGKTTDELNAIAEDEDVTFGEEVKTNADRISAIEAARKAKAEAKA